MLGKNNTSLLIQKSAVRKSQFAIKKLSVGVVSVAVGASLSLGVSTVQAEEVMSNDVEQLVEAITKEVELEDVETYVIEEAVFVENDVLLVQEEVSEEVVLDKFNESTDEFEIKYTPPIEVPIEEASIELSITPVGYPLIEESAEESFSSDDWSNEYPVDGSTPLPEYPTDETPSEESTPVTDETPVEVTPEIPTYQTEILELSLEKELYASLEQIKAKLIVRDDRAITGAYLNYQNNTSIEYAEHIAGDYTDMLANYLDYPIDQHITINENGDYLIEFILNEHLNSNHWTFVPGEYHLNHLSLYAGDELIFLNDQKPLNSSFLYNRYDDPNFRKADAIIIPYETTYTYDESMVREGINGATYSYSNGSSSTLTPSNEIRLHDYQDEVIGYTTIVHYNNDILVGNDRILQEGQNGLTRNFYDQGTVTYSYEKESTTPEIIEVGTLTYATREEREADPNARTTVTLIDYESGYELNTISYSGYQYDYRLDEFIKNFNNEYGTDIAIYDVKRHKHQTITEFINGEDHSIFHQELIYYVKNHSSLDLRDLHFPLSLDTYTNEPGFDNYARYPHSNVTIFNNERILHNFEFNSLDLTLDNIINKSLNLLDSNQYYFDRTRWYASLINNNGVNRIGNQIDLFVKNHLTKELVSAPYGVDFTNDPTKVRDGQNGTKYIYSDGSERFVDLPINAIKLTATELDDKPIIDSVTVEGLQYNINEVVEVTIKGRSKVDIKEIFVMFTNWHQGRTHALTDRQFIRENIEYNNEFFSAKLLLPIHDFTPMNSIGSSEFNFESLSIIDITGKENTFNSEKEYSVDSNGMEQITYLYQPFLATFQISDKALLREEIISFNIQYTTDGSLVREGQNGTKWVYSDGSEVILTEPISKVVLYDNEVVDIEPETEYTIYAHEVRSGISGSKLVFTNGEEKVINNPISAVALYRNKVESFDYTTVQVESSDVPFGEKSVLQDGIEGRRVVFYDADDKIVDSLVLSAPVSRIEQVGANKQTLVLTPFETTYTTDASKVRTGQNGTKYIYSDGREETVIEPVTAVQLYRYADESVGYKQITNENPSLAVGKANVLVKGADGSNRVYYDLNGKVVETRRLTEAVDRVVEVGTLVVEDEVIIPELPKPDLDGDKTEEVKPGAESEKSEELNPAEPEDTGPDADGKDTDESDGKESGSDVDDNESNPKTPDKIDEDTTAIPEGSNDNPVTDQGPLEPINFGIPVNAASILPATGEKGQQVWLTVGAISLLAGFGLVIQGKRKKEEN